MSLTFEEVKLRWESSNDLLFEQFRYEYLGYDSPCVDSYLSRVEPWLPYAPDAPQVEPETLRFVRRALRTEFEHRVCVFLDQCGDCSDLIDRRAHRVPPPIFDSMREAVENAF